MKFFMKYIFLQVVYHLHISQSEKPLNNISQGLLNNIVKLYLKLYDMCIVFGGFVATPRGKTL